jgi:hypothetical protein
MATGFTTTQSSLALLQSLVPEGKAVAVPIEDLEAVPVAADEQE